LTPFYFKMSNLNKDVVNKEFEDLLDHFADADDLVEASVNSRSSDFNFDPDQMPAMDAFRLQTDELMQELEKRGVKPKGFFMDDAKTLQKFLDQEHQEYMEQLLQQREEQKEKLAAQAGMIRRKRLVEKQLKEEVVAVQQDHRIEYWLTLVKSDSTPSQARIELSSITARCLAKAMWNNSSLVNLDLSRNDLDDKAGAFLARMLKNNEVLANLELESNNLGPVSFKTFGESLMTNNTLIFLNLEGNPLTDGGNDNSGMAPFSNMLKHNNSLTSVNLFRAQLGPDAGTELLHGLEQNSSLVFLDVGGNGFQQQHDARVNEKIQENQSLRAEIKQHNKQLEEKKAKEQEEEKKIQDEIQKERDVKAWLEEQQTLRAQARCKATEEAAAKRKAEIEEAKKIAEEKAEAERKAKAEADAKKKKKKGKKGKKK